MTYYIEPGTKVAISTIEGTRTGTVVSYRDTHLAELNPPPPASDKVAPVLNIPVVVPEPDMQRIITLYKVLLDDPQAWPGLVQPDNTVEVYTFIRPLTDGN